MRLNNSETLPDLINLYELRKWTLLGWTQPPLYYYSRRNFSHCRRGSQIWSSCHSGLHPTYPECNFRSAFARICKSLNRLCVSFILENFIKSSLQYCCLENPMNSMKRQNDRILKEEFPRSVGAQYATGDQWRNNSRKKEGMEPKRTPSCGCDWWEKQGPML